MTVAELIEILQTAQPDSRVVLETASGYNYGAVMGIDKGDVRIATAFYSDTNMAYVDGSYYSGHPAQHRDDDQAPFSVVVLAKVGR